MTTEIAVSNQLGIALATDSAVTITSGGHVKVFNTADKLFELSATFPVAVMINGNMDYLGTPWEILVKEFRASEGKTTRSSVEKWARDFLVFVENYNPGAEDSVDGFIDRAIASEISTIQNVVQALVGRYIFDTSKGEDHLLTKGKLNIRQVLQFSIEMRAKNLQEVPVAPSLIEIPSETARERYQDKIDTRLDAGFTGTELSAVERDSLSSLIVEALRRSIATRSATGIVVAGYGANDTFPAVFSAEVDGRVVGKLKVFNEKYAAISGCADRGMVTYFAQTDVTERLLAGVDTRFVNGAADYIERAVTDAMTKTFEVTPYTHKGRKKVAQAREKLIEEMARAAREKFEQTAVSKIKKEFSRQFDSMIAMMPKQELIEFAEALVSITAIERKATVDEGTVGGPVDVALITKHEGFVWIKRKHHFQKELNPRYFWRRFGAAPQGSQGV